MPSIIMITRDGMRATLGLATFEAPRQALFLQGPTGAPRASSDETARGVDPDIQPLLEAAHTRGRETMVGRVMVHHHVPRTGRVLRARGRDAADTALTTPFGMPQPASVTVWTNAISEAGRRPRRSSPQDSVIYGCKEDVLCRDGPQSA
jgi:hypothetical protein